MEKVRITRATVVAGQGPVRAGSVVELEAEEARLLLTLGKAVPVADDGPEKGMMTRRPRRKGGKKVK